MARIFLQVTVDDDIDNLDRMTQVLVEDLLEEDGVESVEHTPSIRAVVTADGGNIAIYGPIFSKQDAEDVEDGFSSGAFIVTLQDW